MSEQMLFYFMLGTGGIFLAIIFAYVLLRKKMMNKETMYVASLVEGTKESNFSMEIFYQKFYVFCTKIPGIRRYTLKIRRRVEIVNLEDEYLTRKQVAQVMFKAFLTIIPLTIVIILMTKTDMILMSTLLLFELFFIEFII